MWPRILRFFLLAVCLFYLASPAVFPVKKMWGDEALYLDAFYENQTAEELAGSITPGLMPLTHRPYLAEGFYNQLGVFSDTEYSRNEIKEYMNDVEGLQGFSTAMALIEYLFTAFAFLAAYLVYWILRQLTQARSLALAGALIFLINPRIWFYTSALWLELLHIDLLLIGAALMLRLLERPRKMLTALLLGLTLGVAALMKGVVSYWVLAMLLWAAGIGVLMIASRYSGIIRTYSSRFFTGIGFDRLPDRQTVIRTGSLVAVVLVSFMTLPTAQRTGNLIREDAFVIAANNCRNIEIGLRPEMDRRIYSQATGNLAGREVACKARVSEYLKANLGPGLVWGQLRQLWDEQALNSFFSRGVRVSRWENSGFLGKFEGLGVALSVITLVFGTAGAAIMFFDLRGVIFSSFVLYYEASLLFVGWNPRFFIQLYPMLLICTLVLISLAWLKLARWRSSRLEALGAAGAGPLPPASS